MVIINTSQTRQPEVKKKKKKAASKHEGEKPAKRQKTEGGLKLNTTSSVEILHMKVRADQAPDHTKDFAVV